MHCHYLVESAPEKLSLKSNNEPLTELLETQVVRPYIILDEACDSTIVPTVAEDCYLEKAKNNGGGLFDNSELLKKSVDTFLP